jgi:hypothetical protein
MSRSAFLALAALLTVSSCADTSPEDSLDDTKTSQAKQEWANRGNAAAKGGPKIRGTGYTYRAPKGWGPSEVPGLNPDSFAANLGDRDGFADNINVIVSPAGRMSADEAEDLAERELAAVGAKKFEAHPRVSLAGDRVAHTSASMSMNDTTYTVEQFYPSHGDNTYVVTFAFSSDVKALHRYVITTATLDSWTWSEPDPVIRTRLVW